MSISLLQKDRKSGQSICQNRSFFPHCGDSTFYVFSLKLLQLNKFNIALYRGFCRWVQFSPFNTCKQFCSRLQFAQTKMCLKRDIMRHWNLPSLNYINLPADKKAKVAKNKTGEYFPLYSNFQ